MVLALFFDAERVVFCELDFPIAAKFVTIYAISTPGFGESWTLIFHEPFDLVLTPKTMSQFDSIFFNFRNCLVVNGLRIALKRNESKYYVIRNRV